MTIKETVMNKLTSGLLATALAASFAIAPTMQASAATVYVPSDQAVSSDIQNVAWRGSDRIVIRNGSHYWRGHRGSSHWREGYRRHGDFWFPLAAFTAGALITGAIVNQPRVVHRSGSAHVQWCYDRYRSYRAYDNTYQPYNGPRRQCYSPYD
jgi:hypothetical protein